MSFGWSNAWYTGLATDLDGKYATAVGHPIESTICYIVPWNQAQGYTNTPADWVNRFNNNPSLLRPFYYDMMVPWAKAAVPNRDMQITIDIAPGEFSGPTGNFVNPGSEDVAGITAWHGQMNAGLWDNAWIAFANMVTSTGLANAHVRPFHEPAQWNYWTSTIDFPGWLTAFNRIVGLLRAHGLTGRIGPSLDYMSEANYSPSSFPGSDCVYYDTYSNRAVGQAITAAATNYCRSHGLVMNLAEIGLYQTTDARGVQFFTEVHDWILANRDIYEGMVYYNENGATDILTGSFPQTLAYVRNNMATWEISAASGGGGTTGTNTATVTGSGSTAHFSGTVASNSLNVTIYRDTYGGTKIADVAPSGGNWSYDKTSETNGPHVYVIAMFDAAVPDTPANVTFGPQTYNLTIDSTLPTAITNRWSPITATGANGSTLTGIVWPTLNSPHAGDQVPVAGDEAVLWVAIGSGGDTPTVSSGFVLDSRHDNSTQVAVCVFKKKCVGGESGAITISNVGAAKPFGLMHASLHGKIGVDQSTAMDVAAVSSTVTGGSTVTIPSVTTTKDGALLMGAAFCVNYSSAVSHGWTASAATSEIVDLFGLEAGTYGKSLEVVEHLQTSAGATGANISTWDTTFSFGIGVAIALRPAAAVLPTQSISNFSVVKDLGVVSIVAGTVTSGIATVKVFEGGVLQGTGPNVGSTSSVGLVSQSAGDHSDLVYGYDVNDVQVAGPYSVMFTVLAAPLISGAVSTLNNVRISANAVTTTIRVYRTVADGGALVTSHAVDALLGWDYTSAATGYVAGRSYDATAYDGTHESARFAFTSVVAPSTPSIVSVTVANNGTVTVVWAGLSIRLFDSVGAVLETVLAAGSAPAAGTTPTGDPEYSYATAPGDGHYTVTAYNNADPASATLSDSAPIDVNVTQTGGGGLAGQPVLGASGGILTGVGGALLVAG